MTANVFVYVVDLPYSVSEMVCPCCDGYCLYLNAKLSRSEQEKSYRHALKHIENGDWDIDCERSVQEIERIAHGKE